MLSLSNISLMVQKYELNVKIVKKIYQNYLLLTDDLSILAVPVYIQPMFDALTWSYMQYTHINAHNRAVIS